ncbi:unnamed protein product [Kuraishia capsulata CBS 1993]|uniref:Nucleoporin NUP188 n=1 Tax=Kuraishia capsulata CBS 1993 TaxID=1382522 RepID=W6MRW9_9ASCO|nr:uncharacterized protein KUCA_T00005115001 [Kuraishia capsulata CBS 1993]CDK29128.1 unnamed protein product [Kuraishia capsulata CBS 1993]
MSFTNTGDTQCWTIENALLLLTHNTGETEILDLVKKFLVQNKSLWIGSTLPFKKTKASKDVDFSDNAKFQLRSAEYSIGTNSLKFKKYTDKITEGLNVDEQEVVRVIIQTSERVPEELGESSDSGTQLFKDRDDLEKTTFYASKLLRERRFVLQIMSLLLRESDSEEMSNFLEISESIASGASQIVSGLVDELETLMGFIKNLDSSSSSLSRATFQENVNTIIDLAKLLATLIVGSDNRVGLSSQNIVKWFKLMDRTDYGSSLSKRIPGATLTTCQALFTIISLLFIDLDYNYGSLEDDATYMNKPQIITEITHCLDSSPTNPIVLYAWAIVMHRKWAVIQEYPDHELSLSFRQAVKPDFLTISNTCAAKAAELDVFSALLKCHSTLEFDYFYPSIIASFVISMVPYARLSDGMASAVLKIMGDAPDSVIERFFAEQSTENALIVARAKVPLSLTRFLQLIGINASLAMEELCTLRSYMEVFQEDEFYYKYKTDEVTPGLIRLTQDIDVYPPFEELHDLSLLLKDGTRGQLIPSQDKSKSVVTFLYEYNGWSLMGRILQNISRHYNKDDKEKLETISSILAAMTRVTNELDEQTSSEVYGYMSAFIDETDVIEVIFRVFDQALASRNMETMVSCVTFFSALALRHPNRIWPYLSLSLFLGGKLNGGLATTLLGSVEMAEGDFSLTLAFIDLTKALIKDCFTLKNDVAERLKSDVLAKAVTHLIHVFEGFSFWRYNEGHQKMEIGTGIIQIFREILLSMYGVDENSSLDSKVTRLFVPSAKKIVETFLVSDLKDVRSTKSLFLMIQNLAAFPSQYQTSDKTGYWYDKWVSSVFDFAVLLVDIRPVVQSMQPSTFELSLFIELPRLVEIYCQYNSLRSRVIALMTSLVSGSWPEEPPSLLAHLGQEHANVLLRSMAYDLNNAFEDYPLRIALYDFFSAVMQGNQEGLSIVLITGKDIKDWLLEERQKAPKDTPRYSLSLLSIFKKSVSQIGKLPDYVALHLVEAIALAFNSWAAVREGGDDTPFLKQLIDELKARSAKSSKALNENSDYISKCYELRLVSKIAEILSLYLFVSQESSSRKLIADLIHSKEFINIAKEQFKIDGYRSSLHANLENNFEKKYSGLSLKQFTKASFLVRSKFAESATYALPLMDQLFDTDAYWANYREEIVLASVNLQYVSAQITSAKAYGALLTSYCNTNDTLVDQTFIDLVTHLLKLNSEQDLPIEMFKGLYKERMELAFLMSFAFSKSLKSGSDDTTAFALINAVSLILFSTELGMTDYWGKYEVAYYTPLLRILLIGLNLLDPNTKLFVEHSGKFIDIFSIVVSRSAKTVFYSVLNEAVNSTSAKDLSGSTTVTSEIADLSLTFSILKAYLRLNLPSSMSSAISNSLSSNGTLKAGLSLYSCSHLIKVDNEEIFADLTLMFIYELVSVRPIAEQLIRQGLLSVLTESPISVRIRNGGISPTTSPRLHHVWSNGLLSVILTLLCTFKERLLPEALFFVSSFSNQITSTMQNWKSDSIVISTPVIQETAQIILLHKLLNSMNADEVFKTQYAQPQRSFQSIFELDTKDQKNDFVGVMNYLISHPKFLSIRFFPTSPEEQRLLNSDGKAVLIERLIQEFRGLKESILT